MRLSKKHRSGVNFAKFCMANNFDPQDAVELIILVDKCVKIGIDESNIKNYPKGKYKTAIKHLEEHCESMGLRIDDWPGLYPTIKKKDGSDLYLPDM